MGAKGEAATPRSETATRLDREQILDVAERIAASEGTSGLTLRRLGSELGVNHTAVYRHFRDKDELLNAVADRLLERRAAPQPGSDWRETFRLQLRHALERYDVHPDLARIIALRPNAVDALATSVEHALAALREVGLSAEDAASIYQLTEAYVVGFGLYSSLLKSAVEDGQSSDAETEYRTLAALPPDRYPNVVESARYFVLDQEEIFERGVEMVVNEVERLARNEGKNR